MRFRDSEGRDWVFTCDYLRMARVKKETGVDLTKAIAEGSTVIQDVIGDPALFFDVVCCLLREQMTDRNLTPEAFGMGLNDEDIVAEATRALVEGTINFFPPNRREPLLKAFRRIWELSKQRNEIEANKATAFIMSPAFDKAAEAAVESGKFNMEPNPSNGV